MLSMTGVLMANSKQAAQGEKMKLLNFHPKAGNHGTNNMGSAVLITNQQLVMLILVNLLASKIWASNLG